MPFRIIGAREMISKLKKFADRYPDHISEAIYHEAEIEMTESKRRCPVDTTEHAPHPGQLRNSGFVHPPQRTNEGGHTNISVTMSYGGPGIDYAVYVHENPDAIHPVGQWKYLESVLNESRPYMAGRIAERVKLSKVRL